MIWEYKTLFFELTTDTANMAAQLNQLGQAGWELVNVALVQDGLLAFLKKNSPAQPAAQGESPQTGTRPSLRSRSARMAPAVGSLLERSLQAGTAEPENNRLGEIRIS